MPTRSATPASRRTFPLVPVPALPPKSSRPPAAPPLTTPFSSADPDPDAASTRSAPSSGSPPPPDPADPAAADPRTPRTDLRTPQAFYLRNQSASTLLTAPLAALPTLARRPAFADKAAFRVWCQDSRTAHVFYTLAEPTQPHLRSSAQNPVKFLHGLVADYDGDAAAIQAALASLTFPDGRAPTWVTTTFSGKARLLWVFERPVPVFNPGLLARFIDLLARELKLARLLPGLDPAALGNPHTPYEVGTQWRQPWGDTRLPSSFVFCFLHDASERAKWPGAGVEIPLEEIAAEVERRWPGRWTGPFAAGARGVRFWDPAADNPAGCTLRAGGVQAWSGEGRFLPWAELLGAEFVKRYRADRLGGAIAGVYFDGREYWRRDGAGRWRSWCIEAMKRHLHVDHGLSRAELKGEPSDVARALTTIEKLQHVDGAFPCLFLRDDVVTDGTHRYLNIARALPLAPPPGPAPAWGEGFPWLAAYFTGLLDDEQRPWLFAWLAHFYQSAAAGRPRRGHALFLAGPATAGKTLLSRCIIGGLVGGFQDASNYLLGTTRFNESLFHAPVWAVDDAVASTDARAHALYTQVVKRLVANPHLEFAAKFKKEITFRHNGRLIVTLNVDEDSLGMLPAADHTITDKLVVLLVRNPGVSFIDVEATLARELPAFAGWLAAHTIPPALQRNPHETARFGHDAFFHPDLLANARESSGARPLAELLDLWRTSYFRLYDKPYWEGNATQLMIALRAADHLAGLAREMARGDQRAFGRNLQKLVKEELPWLTLTRTKTARLYRIPRPPGVKYEPPGEGTR
jgi:hypothetical protein